MPVQMFVVHPKDGERDEVREQLAEFIAHRAGFILMATSYGSLIAAFDDIHVDALKRHPLVDFVGGVSLDPSAPAAAALHRMFAENVAAQLVERGLVNLQDDAPAAATEPVLPARFRTLRWPTLPQTRPDPLFTTQPAEGDDD